MPGASPLTDRPILNHASGECPARRLKCSRVLFTPVCPLLLRKGILLPLVLLPVTSFHSDGVY